MMNPWHDISAGKDAPEIVTGVIEIPKNSRAKYELDKDSGMLILKSSLTDKSKKPVWWAI